MGKQIDALTTTRGVAAIMVVIYHFGSGVFPFNRAANFFHSGALAVSYFFVLSGFVLYTAHEGKKIAIANYFRKRFARIVPVYWLALFLVVCIGYAFYQYSFSAFAIKLILVHAFLLQAYIPDYSMNLNLPGWTLSVEVFFYLIFPLLLTLLKKRKQFFIVMTIVLYILSQVIHLHYFPLRHSLNSNIIDTVFFNPVIHLNQFLIGMLGGYLFVNADLPKEKYKWVLLGSFVVMVLLMATIPQNLSSHVGLIAPVFMVFILSLGIRNPRVLNFKPFVFIGEISYGTYILQLPVFSFFDVMNSRYLHIKQPYFFYFFLFMLVLIASASYVFFEKPLRKKISSIHFRRKSISEP
jgi:peptidoglycan/LPS O-acetylase OafA/YrhL